MTKKNPHWGTTLDTFLSDEGNPEAKLEDYSELNESLAKLDRYERRAFSRRNRALRSMREN